MLREEVANRLAHLTADERTAVTRNPHLFLACFSVEQLGGVAVGG